ncbi:MAG: hypothetical protein K2N74_03730, partial [Clostridiales bacterium]|nr:hypothetical protein [Clostridiales bacterium]
PSVKRVFGTEIAEDAEKSAPKEQPVKSAPKQEQPQKKADVQVNAEKEKPPVKIPIQRLVREKQREETKPVAIAHLTKEVEAQPEQTEEQTEVRPTVITRGAEQGEKTRLLVLHRK